MRHSLCKGVASSRRACLCVEGFGLMSRSIVSLTCDLCACAATGVLDLV